MYINKKNNRASLSAIEISSNTRMFGANKDFPSLKTNTRFIYKTATLPKLIVLQIDSTTELPIKFRL